MLPERKDLDELSGLDGVLIDTHLPAADLICWQNRFAPVAEDLPAVCFSDLSLQHRWLLKTAEEQMAKGMIDFS